MSASANLALEFKLFQFSCILAHRLGSLRLDLILAFRSENTDGPTFPMWLPASKQTNLAKLEQTGFQG